MATGKIIQNISSLTPILTANDLYDKNRNPNGQIVKLTDLTDVLKEKNFADASDLNKTLASAKEAEANAKSSAESANANALAARQSAEKAAASAASAKQSETDLAEAVATAESLDGRITLLENGKGVYKDPSTGAVTTYTPLEIGDGTLKVVSNMGVGKKVVPVELPDNYECYVACDGTYTVFLYDPLFWSATQIWLYDNNLNRLMHLWHKVGNGNGLLGIQDYSSVFAVADGRFYIKMKHYNNIAVFDIATGTALKEINIGAPDGETNTVWSLFYNEQSGHICVIYLNKTGNTYNSTHLAVYDLDLNPVLDENGEQRVDDITEWHTYVAGQTYAYLDLGFSHKRVYGRTYVYPTGTRIPYNTALSVASADDTLEVVHESVVQEDPERKGNSLVERDEDGNPILDDPAISSICKPITTDGREIRFNTTVEAERNYPALARRGLPMFQCHTETRNFRSKVYTMSDGIDEWFILSDGRFVSSYQFPYNGTGYRSSRTGVTNCITSEYTNGNVPIFNIGCEPSDWGQTSTIGFLAYAPHLTGEVLTPNLYGYIYGGNVNKGNPRYLPINLSGATSINASPLGATWGLVGYPPWYITYKSFVSGILM